MEIRRRTKEDARGGCSNEGPPHSVTKGSKDNEEGETERTEQACNKDEGEIKAIEGDRGKKGGRITKEITLGREESEGKEGAATDKEEASFKKEQKKEEQKII